MRPPAALARDATRAAPRAAAALLTAFAFYVAAAALGSSRGLVAVVASWPGLALLVLSGALFVAAAVGAAAGQGPVAGRAARALVFAGTGLALIGVPSSLVLRNTGTITLIEGESLGPRELPGVPPFEVGEIVVLPRGPHLLSKTVAVAARFAASEPFVIGLFPPVKVGPWRLSVFRFGYAPALEWTGADRGSLGSGRILLGTVPHDDEEASLVAWTPEPNVMMGAGTFPPKLEELVVSRADPSRRLFLRIEEATIAGARRDLRDPDAYKWLADGRLEDPLFFVQVLHGREKVFEGRIRGGGAVEFDGGLVALAPDVAIFADLLVTRDRWLSIAGLGLTLLAVGGLLAGVRAAARLVRHLGRTASRKQEREQGKERAR